MTYLKPLLTIVSILLISSVFAQSQISVSGLTCESKSNPVGIEIKNPRLSWIISSSERNTVQSDYHILVSDSPEKLHNNIGNIWDSKIVKSDCSIQVEYNGSPLSSEKTYYWKVKVTNQNGKTTYWSETATWQMGLLTASDWENAKWIGYENLPDSMKVVPAVHGNGKELGNKAIKRTIIPQFRKEFKVEKKIQDAKLYISGLGQYETILNGQQIGKSFLSPGWTFYDKTCLYNTYDITTQLQQGRNAIGVIVGNGFYNINRERYTKIVIAYVMPKMICK